MKAFKTYREQNPGKTYLDFKKYANGGETGEDEKRWLMNWYTKRRLYANQKARYINKQLDVIEKYLVTPSSNANVPTYRVGLDKIPIVINDAKVKKLDPNAKAYYQPNEGIILSKDYKDENRENLLHEMVHSVNRYGSATGQHINSLIRGTKVYDLGKYTNYLTEPNEIYSRLMEFRKLNNMDPLKTYGKPDIERLRKTGKDVDLLNLFPDDDVILDLLNTTAAIKDKDINKVAEGGEIPPNNKPIIPEEPQPYKGKLYKDRYGRKYTEDQLADYYDNSTDEIDRFTGKPFVRGLKPVGDIEDAANVTPVGDAISIYDAYSSAKNKDWLGTGLALFSVLPFVPSSVNRVKRAVPTVNKNLTNDLLNKQIEQESKELALRTKTVNEVYNTVERLMDDPAYLRRAEQVKNQFGTDYSTSYADAFLAYNLDPISLPHVKLLDDQLSMAKAGDMTKHNKDQFTYGISKIDHKIPNVTEHEMSHYMDMLQTGDYLNAEAGNNMFYQMSKDLDKKVDSRDKYFSNPSEQKAHMNQLREYMFQNGMIDSRGDTVSDKMMKNVLNKIKGIDGMQGIFRASEQFKSIKTYTKWFNSIPLLGVGAAAVYSNNQE